MDTDLRRAFTDLAKPFLADHPEIRHEWREISDTAGDRLDLVCGSPQNEVFASVRAEQITVGVTGGRHIDFEDFDRGVTPCELAEPAFNRLVHLLTECGYIDVRFGDFGSGLTSA